MASAANQTCSAEETGYNFFEQQLGRALLYSAGPVGDDIAETVVSDTLTV